MSEPIRVGFIGAGGICRSRHVPNLKQIEGVELAAVCNRSEASSRKAADELGFAQIETDWRKLIERDDLDAVFIGTWPYTHKDMSVAALEAGRHVFCQARMAMDLAEAKQMAEAAERHPNQVSMLCPPPHRMPWEPYIRHMIDSGELGELRSLRLRSITGANLAEQIGFRERVELSGRQVLQVGIWAETLIAWAGEYESLEAMTATPIARKYDENGKPYDVRVPQVVFVQGRLKSGAVVSEQHTGISHHEAENALTIEGSKGTLRVDVMKQVSFAPAGEELKPVDPPAELQRDWRVEQDFIDAVRAAKRGESWSVDPDFHDGLRYMRAVEAIHISSASGKAVCPGEL